jgi:hypothetical protein
MNRLVAPSGSQLDLWIRVLGIEDDVLPRKRTRREATTLRRILSGAEPVADASRAKLYRDMATAMVKRVAMARPNAVYLPNIASVAQGIKLAVAGWDEVEPRSRFLRSVIRSATPPNALVRLEPVRSHLLSWAAWRVLVNTNVSLPTTFPTTKAARRAGFRSAIESARRTDSLAEFWRRLRAWNKKAPSQRTIEGWIEGRGVPRRDQLDSLLAFLDSLDPGTAQTRREGLRTHAMLCSLAATLRKTHPQDAKHLGTAALRIVRRVEEGLRAALETPPAQMQATHDRLLRGVQHEGIASREKWDAKMADEFALIDLWSIVLFGSSRWLALEAVERASLAPPDDEQAKWLRRVGETWTEARTVAPVTYLDGGDSPVDGARIPLQQVQRFLSADLTPQVLLDMADPDDVAALFVPMDGETASGHLIRGTTLLGLGYAEQAEASLLKAADDPIDGKAARRLIGLHYVTKGRYGDAVAALESIDDLAEPDAEVLRSLLRCYIALGETKAAAKIARRGRTLNLSGFDYDRRRRQR